MKNDFTIEKNIKVPKKLPLRRQKYPFPEMKVGDSFLAYEEYSRELMAKISNAARNWKKTSNPDWKFAVRKTEHGIRIWRIK